MVKQLRASGGSYIEMDGAHGLGFSYELNAPSDGRWFLIVESFNYCRDASGAKLGRSDGVGGAASYRDASPYHAISLSGQAGSEYAEFGVGFLVPPPGPPTFPIRCTGIQASVRHYPNIDPGREILTKPADRLERFELEVETSWGFLVHWWVCPECTGDW